MPHRLVLAVLTLGLLVTASNAETFEVCPSCPYTSIQAAIDDAEDGDVIQLFEHLYTEGAVIDTRGKAIRISGVTTPSGPGSILDGGEKHRVLQCMSGETASTVFENLLIRNGFDFGYAGGMFLFQASPSLIGCAFQDNAAGFGGGMKIFDSSPRLEDCVFTGNHAEFEGAGIEIVSTAQPTFIGCTFTDNVSAVNGGAISCKLFCAPIYEDCLFQGNSAQSGGAMFNMDQSTPTLTDCRFEANSARNGGAMANVTDGNAELNDCEFMQNTASGFGGAMFNTFSHPTMNDCVFDRNDAPEGGCIYNMAKSAPVATNCDFTDNTAKLLGGAVCNLDSRPRFIECRFTANTANWLGGGMLNFESRPELIGCTFTGNIAEEAGGGMASVSNSIPTLSGCVFCGNTVQGSATREDQIDGYYHVGGGQNCIIGSCDDDDLDGLPDDCEQCSEDPDGDGICGDLDACPNWPGECSKGEAIIYVTSPGESIQQAVDAVVDGGIVDIGSGTYPVSSTINLRGKAFTMQGRRDKAGLHLTTIDAQGSCGVMVAERNETNDTLIRDLVLTGGSSTGGGGLKCINASDPMILDCVIRGNTAEEHGGGIHCTSAANPLVTGCLIVDNVAGLGGGGVSIDDGGPDLVDCTIAENQAPQGGGIHYSDTFIVVTLDGCTVVDNEANGLNSEGGGVYGTGEGELRAYDTVFCGNTVEGLATRENQIAGEFDDEGGNCVSEECIDDGAGGVACRETCIWDLDGNGRVDAFDLAYVLGYWGSDDIAGDINLDGIVDAVDLGLVIAAWGPCP